MKVPAALVLSTFLLYCTLLQSQGVIIEGPQTVIYFPGQGSIQLVCNATEGPVILWAVNGASFSLIALRDGALPNHTANGTNIVINVPTNNSEYICTATTNLNATSSNPAFVYIAAVPDQVPSFTGMANSMTLEGNTLNITLSWGEPFNNFDPIRNYTVTCSGDAQCPQNFTTADNTTRSYNVYNLNATITFSFTVVATNSLGSGEPTVFMTAPLTVPDEVTGLNLTCELAESELYYTCTAIWNPVTIGNGPLEQPLMYRVYYNGYFENVTSPTTYLIFRAPAVPEGYFVSNVTAGVTAINRFGAGPPSENVSAEIMAPSVTGITATPYTDVPSNRYDYTIICTIHPESTADTCEVMVRSGAMSITNSSAVINGSATIIISGLNCLEAYTVTAGGTLDGTLVGPRSSHEPITTGVCMPTVAPTTSSMIVTMTSTSVTTPSPTGTETGSAMIGTTCSIILVALTTVIAMVMQW